MTCFPRLSRRLGFSTERFYEVDDEVAGLHNVKFYSYKELRIATNDFTLANKIGEGGFGSVYKGRLKDGKIAAIKVLSAESRQGGGHNSLHFSWQARSSICIGVARGLAFLHEEVRPHIVHRDIKASNILLDKDLTPKISDFGLAKLIPANMTHVSTRVAGTIGYLAPEYAIRGQLTRKADIYSFGVLLVEIVSGRCNTNTRLPIGEHYLIERTWELYEQGELVALVDTSLDGDYDAEQACRFLNIGLLCTQDAPKLRPSMSTVVKMLTGEMDLDASKITKPGLISDFMDLKVRGSPKTKPRTKISSYTISSGSDTMENSTFSSQTTTNATTFTTTYDKSSESEVSM
ncbi:cold-responsive protein kinase 1 isoform X2 [Tripterygium wilfordii]|uniref:cold-responsive protein kinase 1 isoform X2 n=1 Tax=Tripterygium wilfordii TaxID=458696 RepID=UPI0018F7F17E|nr:cold-responsive protein kinase 1 isoform X2 [Tripterygium wilfordii]